MKKMTKGLAVLTAVVLLFAFAGQAGAFCVHNYSDREMKVVQIKNGSIWKPFSATLDPTDKACCHWDNTDCNQDGRADAPVGFTVSKVVDGGVDKRVCSQYTIPANGDLYIYKKNDSYVCEQTLPPMPVPPPQPVIK